MRILIIGGSVFLGRAVAETALRMHHEVLVLNRGLSRPNAHGVVAIVGDRNETETLARARANGPFDLVVDTSGFEPETVALSGRMLADICNHYVFISSVSAFADWPAQPVSELSPLLPFSKDERSYGSSKAECERILRAQFGPRLSVLYPGVLIGPNENVGRLLWWLDRFAKGGSVIRPKLDVPISPIDARDVADFVLTLAARSSAGKGYVVSGVSAERTLDDLLSICATVTNTTARSVSVEDEILLSHEVEPWSELPFWAPRGVGADGIWSTDCSAALRAGLRLRPLSDTVADTWSWMQSIGAVNHVDRFSALKEGVGLSADKESRIFAALFH
ncbi:hypothetical protein KEM60_01302 [Austwickia sp. TVS 96-490-7B]|uniref:NAD-dependent epimerase/dehydratase family protein n=1 Tax=Austwickia sp. TVS 96-490-7B TaxID=2830843 RepID=UPI001C5649C3|nr:NAD-dependent epimerase/dehydratase family protein [Austwickia sp. TVS 96-490-7B]MBW3085108.1 hypothetical protein [Austwickia sp. TVS 96-490-7B]